MNKEYTTKEDEQSIKSLITTTQSLPAEIKNYEQAVQVTEVLVKVKGEFDRLETQRKRYTAPINESIDNINEDFKCITGPLKILEKKLKEVIELYADAHKKEVLAQAKEGGMKSKDLALIDTSEKIVSDLGEVRFRTDYDLKITNKNLIPDEFYVIDESAILARIKAGDTVPGVKVVESYKAAVYISK